MPGTPRSKKNACGRCNEDCSTGNAIPCGFCETWFHTKCVGGMTAEFIDCCDKMNRLTGGSAFLCISCRKLATKLNGSFKEMGERLREMESHKKVIMEVFRR